MQMAVVYATGLADCDLHAACLRLMKPGSHGLGSGGSSVLGRISASTCWAMIRATLARVPGEITVALLCNICSTIMLAALR